MISDMDVWEILIKFLVDGFTMDDLNMCDRLFQNVSSASSTFCTYRSENNTRFWKFIHISALVIYFFTAIYLLILINVPYIFCLNGY